MQKFTKMHSAGNDYIFVEVDKIKNQDQPQLARKISHRHYGVGSDGLVVIYKNGSLISLKMYNSDGSESPMCGNALICIGKYLFERKLILEKSFLVELGQQKYKLSVTLDEQKKIVTTTVHTGSPDLTMKNFVNLKLIPKTNYQNGWVEQVFNFGDWQTTGTLVSFENPHLVIFCDNVRQQNLEKLATAITDSKFFPAGINLELAQIKNKQTVFQRTWERGSGETWACGSGACAVCVAGFLSGKTQAKISVNLLGGILELELKQNHILMSGTPTEIFSFDF